MKLNLSIEAVTEDDKYEHKATADIGFDLDPIAIDVSSILSKFNYDFSGSEDKDAIIWLVYQHIEELFNTISDISKTCSNSFDGETGHFQEYMLKELVADNTIH